MKGGDDMKKSMMVLCAMLLVFGLAVGAHAALIDNNDGTVTQIRNDGSRLMWLEDANYTLTSGYDPYNLDGRLYYDEAVAWTEGLNFAGHDDWRLPINDPVGDSYDYALSYDGSTDYGYNITNLNSEMSYMYYVELGNIGYFDTSGNTEQPGWEPFGNVAMFDNLRSYYYWSGSEWRTDIEASFTYDFFHGGQGGAHNDYAPMHVWAARDMSPIPEPSTVLLLGSGLIGLAGVRKKIRKS